jgi:hypothetical protein
MKIRIFFYLETSAGEELLYIILVDEQVIIKAMLSDAGDSLYPLLHAFIDAAKCVPDLFRAHIRSNSDATVSGKEFMHIGCQSRLFCARKIRKKALGKNHNGLVGLKKVLRLARLHHDQEHWQR